jgi:hypothetical protein
METPVEISYAGVVVGRANQVRSLDGEAQAFFLYLPEPLPVGTVVGLTGNMQARVEKVIDSTDASYAGMYVRVLAAGEDPARVPYTYYETPAIPESSRGAGGSDSGRVAAGGRPARATTGENPIVVHHAPSAQQAPVAAVSGTIVGEISSARRAPTPAIGVSTRPTAETNTIESELPPIPPSTVPAVGTAPPEAVPVPVTEPASGSRRATMLYNTPAAIEELRGGGGAPPEMPPDAPRAATPPDEVASSAFSGAPTVSVSSDDEKSGAVDAGGAAGDGGDGGDLPPAKPLPVDARRRGGRRRKTLK